MEGCVTQVVGTYEDDRKERLREAVDEAKLTKTIEAARSLAAETDTVGVVTYSGGGRPIDKSARLLNFTGTANSGVRWAGFIEIARLPLTPTVPTNPIDRTVSERTNALDAFWRMTQPVNPCAEVELPFKEEEELSEC